MELRRAVESSDFHRSGFGHQILRLWRPLGHQKSTRRAPRSPKKPPRSSRGVLKRLPRGSLEVLWKLLEVQKAPQATILDTFIGFRASKIPPGGPQVTIYRPCRRLRTSGRGAAPLEIRLGRARSDPRTIIMIVVRWAAPLDFRLSRARADPRTRSRTRFIPLLFVRK